MRKRCYKTNGRYVVPSITADMQRNYNEESTRLHAELSTRLEKLEDLVHNLNASMSDTSQVVNGVHIL